jgi:hypothetical protein
VNFVRLLLREICKYPTPAPIRSEGFCFVESDVSSVEPGADRLVDVRMERILLSSFAFLAGVVAFVAAAVLVWTSSWSSIAYCQGFLVAVRVGAIQIQMRTYDVEQFGKTRSSWSVVCHP